VSTKIRTIQDSDLNYSGSITIDEEWMQKAGLAEYEKVHVLNINNGERGFKPIVVFAEEL